jgi:hypothetical protein
LLDRRGHAGGQPSTSDRHEDRGHVRLLLQDLQSGGALSGDYPLVIEWRHHGQATCGGFFLGPLSPIGGCGAGEDHFGAVRSGAFDLDLRGGRGHDDHGGGAQRARGKRQGLSMISGGVGNDPVAALRLGQLRDHVVGTANLERASRLEAFHFEQQRPACRSRHVHERRDLGNGAHSPCSGADGVEGDEMLRRHRAGLYQPAEQSVSPRRTPSTPRRMLFQDNKLCGLCALCGETEDGFI